ncbi:CbiX/SirB N-terminal domain-containing protein [Corynebacterium falsenii]|uniref:sirohydrochlorin chelatase n=1 Tax=Corynebacterium falsenii TaxID=108486 RepID=UPI001CCF5DA8|nr:CbiX/SirB N-terminal domain-containing protein [Corynebacterium falsenii]UBI06788.1 CbiX/SirB N-terminal domain-containing protein [Corynebacterium falsenii]
MARPIICFAHGSRHPHADQVVQEIADAVRQGSGAGAYPAYLDFNPRTLTNVAHLLRADGYDEATVVPLLFTDAFHMRHDVPAAIDEAEAATGITLHLAKGLGTGETMVRVASDHIRNYLQPQHTKIALFNVGKPVPDFAQRLAAATTAREARSFSLNDRDELLAYADPADTLVVPLFVCPGVLWDQLCERMPSGLARAPHLGAAVAPAVIAQAQH